MMMSTFLQRTEYVAVNGDRQASAKVLGNLGRVDPFFMFPSPTKIHMA